MNWFHLKLCLIAVVLLTPYFVSAEDDHNFNLNDEDELVPSEQTIDNNDVATAEKKVSAQPARKLLRQSFLPNLSRNIGQNSGFQLARGLIQAPLVGSPFDNQASSPSNKVLLVLNNDKNKFADLARPAEESLKRLTRNPDVMDDIVGQFQQLGGGVTQQLLQQVTQTAPEMSRSFGQALNEALSQTNLLAQAAPGNIDFGQLGQSLSQSFIVGAAQNLLNPAGAGQAAPEDAAAAAEEAAADAEADPEVGAAAEAEPEPEPEPEAAAEPEAPAAPEAPKNPFDQIVGSALLPQLPQLSQLNLGFPPQLPLGLFSPLAGLNPFMPLGSEISEVRVMPDQYSPYKISPRPVDHQTLAEMKLKAVLKEALTKKTIPILWFHLPANHHLQKNTEDLEMEAKLEIFEKQVIAELKQLQELSKLANDVKRSQLENGAQPTTSLTTKLNLYEIPVYEITLGDIEKTLKDEHVIILMHTILQNQNKQFHRHHQATTKYLTDLTGAPIKRQTKTAEDALKTMEKDDMMKMMTYAYRMAAMNGHEMPWLKNEKIMGLNEKDASKTTMTSQQRQSADGNMPMTAERQWLEEKQRQMAEERRQKVDQNQVRQWADPNMQQLPQQQPIERQWANPNMMQQQMPIQRQMLPPQMQQPMPIQRQMLPPQMLPPFPIQNQMIDPNMQWQPQDMQRQMMPQPTMSNFDRPNQMPMQRQWGLDPANMQQQQQQPMMQRQMTNPMMQQTQFADPTMQPMQRQWADANMPETKGAVKSEQQPEQRQAAETKMPEQQSEQRKASEPTGALKKPEQLPEQRQWIDTKTTEQTAAKTDANMPRKNERLDNMPVVGESKPQMAENAGKGRHKGMEDLFSELDVFDHGKHKGKEAANSPPTIINYYYSTGGNRYPPVYAPAPAAPQNYGPPPPPQSYAPAGGYARPPSPPSYAAAPQYKPAAGHYGGAAYGSNAYGSYGGYRSATGDEEIAVMLQQNQPMPKMMMMPNNEEPAPPTITTSTTTTATENYLNNAEHPNINHAKSNQTLSSLASPTSTSTSTSSSTITISSLSPSTSSSPESSNNSDSGPEVGSLFSFEPHLLEPFMGLHSVDHADDPWHHKAYNLYQPIFTGGGTFEEYIKSGRYKRDLPRSPASTTFSKTGNVLTPDMLERLLRIKSSFKKNYPVLYKSMLGQLTNGKSTTITVTPPEVPQHVSYRNVELAAAEINPLETLIDTYQEDLQNILAAQRQNQQQREFHDPLIKPYTNEFNFWGNPQEVVTSNTPQEETHIFPQTSQQLALNPQNEELSFWENSQETLKTTEESPTNPTLNEPQTYWENSQETLNSLKEAQTFLEQPQENINDHSVIKHNSQESVNEPQSYWENSEETLKTLREQHEFLEKPQVVSPIEEQHFWETPEEMVSDVHKLPQDSLTSVNEEEEFWESSPQLSPETSVVQKRSSFWAELEAEEHENKHEQHNLDDSEPIFDLDEDFD